jgi:hypothetical protein
MKRMEGFEDFLDDYRLGNFLSDAQKRLEIQTKVVCELSQIPENRYVELLNGSGVGIRHKEAVALAGVLEIDVEQIISLALGMLQ